MTSYVIVHTTETWGPRGIGTGDGFTDARLIEVENSLPSAPRTFTRAEANEWLAANPAPRGTRRFNEAPTRTTSLRAVPINGRQPRWISYALAGGSPARGPRRIGGR